MSKAPQVRISQKGSLQAWIPWGGPATGPSSQACPGLATWSGGVQATEKQTGRPSHAHNRLQNKQVCDIVSCLHTAQGLLPEGEGGDRQVWWGKSLDEFLR